MQKLKEYRRSGGDFTYSKSVHTITDNWMEHLWNRVENAVREAKKNDDDQIIKIWKFQPTRFPLFLTP